VKKTRVWHASNSFHYAGTDRAMAAWCLDLDRRRFEVAAFSRLEGGAWLPRLKAAGVPARLLGPDPAAWRAAFRRSPCDLLHIHRHGAAEPGWNAVIAEARAAGVRIVAETNIFGARDAGGEGLFDHHFFISAMCLWRYAGWPKRLPAGFFSRHSLLSNPLRRADFREKITASSRAAARKSFGIPEGAFVLGRLGRPDRNKWPAWLPKAFAAFAARRPEAVLLLMQAPPGVREELRALGVEGQARFAEASPEWKRVREFYAAVDCLAHASRVGESFGYTLAEAQAFGIPVVVESTPWADNAQVELVSHGRDGLVAGRPAAFNSALEALASDPRLARRLGAAGREAAWSRFESKKLAGELGEAYLRLLAGRAIEPQPFALRFGPGYAERLKRRQAPSFIKDGAWALRSAIMLYWRGALSRALKRLGIKR
jgi:glycosyltransferase involved in cell wall biosynthesis